MEGRQVIQVCRITTPELLGIMYDHTYSEEYKFGFTGFMTGSAAGYPRDGRKELVLSQLAKLSGEKARSAVITGEPMAAEF